MIFILENLYKIADKSGKTVTFVPNYVQQKINDKIILAEKQGKNLKIVIIKGRQQGVSAHIERVMLSNAMTKKNFTAYTLAHNAPSAEKLFDNHLKYAFDTLPIEIKSMYNVKNDNVKTLKFESDFCYNSSISVGTSARSGTIHFLHVSEGAFVADNRRKWKELKTGSFQAASGHIIIESTALGFNPFYDFVQEKLKDKFTDWEVMFFCWTESEEYQETPPEDPSWLKEYKALAERHGLCPNPIKAYGLTLAQLYWYYGKAKELKEDVKQEYPFELDEAFVATSRTPFKIQDILQAEREITLPVKVNTHGVEFYVLVNPNHTYSIGIDPSGGGKDEAVIAVWDFDAKEQAAEYRGTGTPKEVGSVAMEIGELYNQAFITCEINGVGLATQKVIQGNYYTDRQYKRLVVDNTNPIRPKIAKFGWETRGDNRADLIFDFQSLFESKQIKINSKTVLAQMKTFVKKESDNDRDKKVRYEHESGKHDDALFASMIAIQGFEYIRNKL